MNIEPFKEALRAETNCEARFDPLTCMIYSIDASIYEVTPAGVVIPKTRQELQKIVELAKRYSIPIIPRGAATGITGGALGDGIIIDTSKYLNQILSIDYEKKIAVCEPGVIQDDLNRALQGKGYRLGPDTSTGDRATLGGMLANNAAGARSMFYGKMIDAIVEAEMILSTGECVTFKQLTQNEWLEKLLLPTQEGAIYRTVEEIRSNHAALIRERFPPLPRRASGYALDALLTDGPPNLAKLLAGSEGSFGVFSTITVRITPVLKNPRLYLFYFDSMQKAMEAVPEMLHLPLVALELIDDKILRAGQSHPALRGKLNWLKSTPQALIVAETETAIENLLKPVPGLKEVQPLSAPEEMQQVWAVRKAGLGLLLSKRSYSRAIAFIEDLSIPPQNLALFMQKFLPYLQKQSKEAGIYGHAGPGCLHIRPFIDLSSKVDAALMKHMMLDITDIVLEMQGALSGEHGDGRIRTWLNEKLFGKEIVALFQQLKNAFDPLGIMNPHKVVNPLPLEKDIRISPLESPPTFFSFKEEGGFALSVDLCNGNGLCRKKEGVMCPSFQVTHDENDTTRARAETLRRFLKGDPKANYTEVLDLCIQCKGCKTECPSNVDMAKMKSEMLYQTQEKNGYSFLGALFAHVDRINRLAYPLRSIYNPFVKSSVGKKLLSLIGIAPAATLPLFANKRFSAIFATLKQQPGKPIVLFNDTYTEFNHPDIGVAAVTVLNHLGFEVIIPPWSCCGRPAISKGFLPDAKEKAKAVIKQLKPYLDQDMTIIGLEPSCILSLVDEYTDFFPDDAKALKRNCHVFDTFIADHLENPLASANVSVHTHCHQKALVGVHDTLKALRKATTGKVTEIQAGCCGMAGSFGYEKKHRTFSEKIADLKLLPYIRQMAQEDYLVADGFSCRTQIQLGTARRALHLAEFLQLMLAKHS